MNALNNDLARTEIDETIENTAGETSEAIDPRDGAAFTQDAAYSEDPAGN